MYLYKYVSNPDFILEDGYIRATQLSALNDPFEAYYNSNHLKKLAKEFNYELEVKELIAYIDENKHKVGVISLTKSKDNLLMWSHYANEHKGALIGFSFHPGNESIFTNLICDNGTSFDTPFNYFNATCSPIKYRKQPLYKIDKFERDYSNVSMEREDRILYEIFQQKSEEWIYEKEHRITLKLEQANKVILDDIDKYKDMKFIDNMLNGNILEKPTIKKEGKKLYIFLEDMKDEGDRSVLGNLLASLAKDNPTILYLFKIDSSSICSITYGIRTDKESKNKEYLYPKQIGYFEKYQAILKKKSYTLKFKSIQDEVT